MQLGSLDGCCDCGAALILPPAWELPYAAGVALKNTKQNKMMWLLYRGLRIWVGLRLRPSGGWTPSETCRLRLGPREAGSFCSAGWDVSS